MKDSSESDHPSTTDFEAIVANLGQAYQAAVDELVEDWTDADGARPLLMRAIEFLGDEVLKMDDVRDAYYLSLARILHRRHTEDGNAVTRLSMIRPQPLLSALSDVALTGLLSDLEAVGVARRVGDDTADPGWTYCPASDVEQPLDCASDDARLQPLLKFLGAALSQDSDSSPH